MDLPPVTKNAAAPSCRQRRQSRYSLQGVLQGLAGLEHDAAGSGNGDRLTGAGVDALTLGALTLLKGAKTGMVIFSPSDMALLSASNTALTACSALFLLISVFAATCAIRSVFVIKIPSRFVTWCSFFSIGAGHST